MVEDKTTEPVEPTNNNNNVEVDPLEKFGEIKEKYEKTIQDKDKEIEELKAKLKAKDDEVDDTINELNNEVNEKLQQAEELKKLQENVNE